MSISVENSAGEIVVSIVGDLTIFEVSVFKEAVAGVVISGRRLVVDLGAANTLDGAGAQALLALEKKVHALGLDFSIRRCSDPVHEALQLIGLGEHFKMTVGEIPGE